MEVIAFIKNYWQYFAVVVLALLELISIIVKKRPKTTDEFEDCVHMVLSNVADYVCLSEKLNSKFNGEFKKNEVISHALNIVSRSLSRDLTDREQEYIVSLVSSQIETILTAPTKKGGFGREKTI